MALTKQVLEHLRAVAYRLYLRGDMSQGTIAEHVGVSAVTMSKWATEGDWETKRALHLAEAADLRQDTLALLKYQIKCLNQYREKQETAGGDLKPIPNADIDGLSKLYKNLGQQELDYEDRIRFATEFVKFAAAQNLPAAELSRLHALSHEYLTRNRELL